MAVLYNHIHSTHSIKVGNRLRSEVQEVQRLVLSLSKSLYLSQSRNKKLKILIKKILAVESLGIANQVTAVAAGVGGRASLRAQFARQRSGSARPLSLLGGWADVPFPLLILLLFRDAIISKVIWRKHVFSFGFALQFVNFRSCEYCFCWKLYFFFSFPFHSLSPNDFNMAKKNRVPEHRVIPD